MILKLLPNKSQTTSILFTELAKAAADQNTNSAIPVLATLFTFSLPACLEDSASESSSAISSCIDRFSDTSNNGSSKFPTCCSCDISIGSNSMVVRPLFVSSLGMSSLYSAKLLCFDLMKRLPNLLPTNERTKISLAGITSIGKANVIVMAKQRRPTNNSGSFSSKSSKIFPCTCPEVVQPLYNEPVNPIT